jgi:hypothetical protein
VVPWYKGAGEIHINKGRVGEERREEVRTQIDVPLHYPPFKSVVSQCTRIARRLPGLL